MATEELKLNTASFTDDILRRLTKLEASQEELVRKHYEVDKELSNIQIDVKYIREGLDQQKAGINKLLWGIGLVFVTYIVGFVVQGGFNTVGG